MIWKQKSGACKQVKKETAVRLNPMDAASTLSCSSSSQWELRMKGIRSKSFKRSSAEDSKIRPLRCIWKGERRLKRRQERRTSSRQLGPPAPGWRNKGILDGSVFDLARVQDANGESPKAARCVRKDLCAEQQVNFHYAILPACDDGSTGAFFHNMLPNVRRS